MSNKLKEYIKSLVKKELDEESVSGDAGAYMTPRAFAGNKKGDNNATKESERLGFKKTKMKEGDYDKASPSSSPSEYLKESPSSNPSLYLQKSPYTSENMKEELFKVIQQELLKEVTYSKFKKDVSYRTKTEMLHKGIKEVKRKLAEIDRIVEYTSRMKQELSEGEEGIKYWKATEKNVSQIAEMVNTLNEKIKNLHQ